MRYDEAVTKFFLAQYVRARESWLSAAAEENFRAATILSEPGEQQRWGRFFSANNQNSPQVVWGRGVDWSRRPRARRW
jgi:type IV secretion system protein VirB8